LSGVEKRPMSQSKLLLIQFLEWIERRPRTRADVQEAWPSTCPLNCVWEDAVTDDLVGAAAGYLVLTAKGRALLGKGNGDVAPTVDRAA